MFPRKNIAVLAVLTLPLGLLYAQQNTLAYKVDPGPSTIKWVGKKVTGEHHGSISIKKGVVRAANGEIVGGIFVIDTTRIVVEDMEENSKEKLTGHLKSDDFFGVEKHPTATFEITGVGKATDNRSSATHLVTGNLTIKGKTNPLTFPAKILVTPKRVTAEAKGVEVDRPLYDIRYGSGKFFENLGDKAIHDNFWLDIWLVATR